MEETNKDKNNEFKITAEIHDKKYEFVYPEGIYSSDIKQALCAMRDHLTITNDEMKDSLTIKLGDKESVYTLHIPEGASREEVQAVLLEMRDYISIEEFKNIESEKKEKN